MPAQPLTEIMAEDWAEALRPVEDAIHGMGDFLRQEHAQGQRTFPPGPEILRAFQEPMAEVRVLILGQDPYPTPGHAMGLSTTFDGVDAVAGPFGERGVVGIGMGGDEGSSHADHYGALAH